jgi:hypothetical protein
LPAVHAGTLDIPHWIQVGGTVRNQVREERRQRRQSAADRAGFCPPFLHEVLPSDDGATVHLSKFVGGSDADRPNEVSHIPLVGTTGVRGELASQPEILLGYGLQELEGRQLPRPGSNGLNLLVVMIV